MWTSPMELTEEIRRDRQFSHLAEVDRRNSGTVLISRKSHVTLREMFMKEALVKCLRIDQYQRPFTVIPFFFTEHRLVLGPKSPDKIN